jgi:hypothetical protein
MNRAVQAIIAIGLFFAIGNVVLKVIGTLLDGERVALNADLAWTAVFWFCGGSLVGYVLWRGQRK